MLEIIHIKKKHKHNLAIDTKNQLLNHQRKNIDLPQI